NNNGKIINIIQKEVAGENILHIKGIVAPGFINAHCHLELSHLKNKIKTHTGLPEFIKQVISLREANQDIIFEAIEKEEQYMYNHGIVAVGDICNVLDTLQQKSKKKLDYYNFIEAFDLKENMSETMYNTAIKNQQIFINAGLEACVVPHAPYTVSDKLFKLLSTKYKSNTISIHNQESIAEKDFLKNHTGSFAALFQFLNLKTNHLLKTGKSSIESTYKYLQDAKNVIFVHNSFTTETDIKIAIQEIKNSFWCICIKANLYIENTIPPISLLKKNNAQIVVGTDSLSSNNQLCILEELKTIRTHFPTIPTIEILKWATKNGAKALQMENKFGTIEIGKTPGIVAIEGLDENNEITKHSTIKRII
ncbi:MAG: amidohydrolase family protein, partial [Sediminibacterium sp.]|nr:amidohydrolase family protein [Sediminibacterium sp.]